MFVLSTPALATALVAFSIVAGASPTSDVVVKHNWNTIPKGWEFHSLPSADHPIDLRIGLRQHRIDDLIATLYEVSDPFHPNYGQHLSKAYAHCQGRFSLLTNYCVV